MTDSPRLNMERLKNELDRLETELVDHGAPMTYRRKVEDLKVAIRWLENRQRHV